ncbi:uncharacterized protein LOC135956361 isoform X2 [Calliphora vicina]|uniref:uncharacterized protein LOC135956361 isoform X2 n=1 Tax=Calliphora vicina TaxID=7373 RepID=UPI00325B47F4
MPKVNKRLFARENLNHEYNGKHNNINYKFSLLGEDENLNDRCSTNEKLNDDLNKHYLNEIDFLSNHYVSSHNYNNRENYINPDKDLLAPKMTHSNALIYRREVPGGGLLNNVAQKLNTSTFDLADKLTRSQNGQNNEQFAQMVQSYLTNSATSSSIKALNRPIIPTVENPKANLQTPSEQNFNNNREYLENKEHFEDITISSLTAILDRVLNKLESLHDGKKNDYDDHPDGAACDIVGSWSSTTLGLCFDIQLQKDKFRYISPAEINNKILTIGVVECTPAKHHQVIDLNWKFTGSALKQWGGLFHVYGQKRSESVAATFLGFCRTCGGIDTIFGSWNFLSPSKDCNDISLAFEVKRDVLRRVRMEMKRKERFKDLLYRSRHGKT